MSWIPSETDLAEAVARLEKVIGETEVADGISEKKWMNGFMQEIRRISRDQAEKNGLGKPIVDKGTYALPLERWVHARVLYMILDLVAWMGPQWRSHFGQDKQVLMDLISRAFDSSLN
jgi:hypothetical protein